jgi:hypothetical protein
MKKQFFTKPVKWKVDSDYANKLSKAEQEWLAAFNDAEYANDFRALEKLQPVSDRIKKNMTDDRNAARRDLYNSGGRRECQNTAEFEQLAQKATQLADLIDEASIVAGKAKSQGKINKRKESVH